MCCPRQCRYKGRESALRKSVIKNPYLVRKSSSVSKNCRCKSTVYALCSTVNDEPASPRPGSSNPVLAIAMAVAGSCSSFLARLNGANKPTGRTAEAPRPMGSRREGSLPRQNWVSVNSAGAFPASQYFLPGLAPWSPGPVCLQLLLLLLPDTLAPQMLPLDFDQGSRFSFLCRTDETGLLSDSGCISIEHI